MTLFLTACSGLPRRYRVFHGSSNGWSSTYVDCDSVKAYGPNHVIVYVDGTSVDIYAERILISN